MTVDLMLLFASLPVFALYLGAQTVVFRQQYGVEFAATARDAIAPAGVMLGRAERALRNFQETWPVFIVLALIANLATPGDAVVFWGAIVWLVARVAYLPLYLAGVVNIRSLAWVISVGGLAAMFLGVLF